MIEHFPSSLDQVTAPAISSHLQERLARVQQEFGGSPKAATKATVVATSSGDQLIVTTNEVEDEDEDQLYVNADGVVKSYRRAAGEAGKGDTSTAAVVEDAIKGVVEQQQHVGQQQQVRSD